jgi:hypothetical protein
MTKLKRGAKTKSTSSKMNARRKKSVATSSSALRGKALERAVERFQSEPDEKSAHAQWKQIESSVFGVRFEGVCLQEVPHGDIIC